MAARRSGHGSVQVPAGPVQAAPVSFVATDEQRRILAGVLEGVELGAWDERMLEWLAGWDAAAVLTVASWIVRARATGPLR
jgi:hypothetical protein